MSNGLLAAAARTGILSTLFAVALLASGQNSTITGTLTGQVIMEGFIHLRMPLWARRLITRLLSGVMKFDIIFCSLLGILYYQVLMQNISKVKVPKATKNALPSVIQAVYNQCLAVLFPQRAK